MRPSLPEQLRRPRWPAVPWWMPVHGVIGGTVLGLLARAAVVVCGQEILSV